MAADVDPSKRMGNSPAFKPLSERLGKKPAIAAVNGLAMGGGTEFVVNYDLVIATNTTCFGLPEANEDSRQLGVLYHDSSVRLDYKDRLNLPLRAAISRRRKPSPGDL
jgi:Enoyl-CoA hydratase/isomerase